jgi:hypothetical protein
MPRVDRADRALRDARILRLFLSGWTMTDIAKHSQIKLSRRGVEIAIQRQLAADGSERQVLSDEARQVYTARIELLLSRLMPRALDPADPQQIKAWESCRRMIEQEARMMGVDRPHNGHDLEEPEEKPEPGKRQGTMSLDEYRRRFRERHGDDSKGA